MAKERPLGLMGTKLGMTQVFGADGKRIGVTVIELGPNVVTQKKDQSNDGYSALQLGFHDKKEKHATKAALGHAKKANTAAKRYLREFRVTAEEAGKYELGAQITCDLFKDGDVVDVSAKTKGRGYQGVIRRWGFHGKQASHGNHEFFRHGGSIGNREFPGRVFKKSQNGRPIRQRAHHLAEFESRASAQGQEPRPHPRRGSRRSRHDGHHPRRRETRAVSYVVHLNASPPCASREFSVSNRSA